MQQAIARHTMTIDSPAVQPQTTTDMPLQHEGVGFAG